MVTGRRSVKELKEEEIKTKDPNLYINFMEHICIYEKWMSEYIAKMECKQKTFELS